jgi:hypothetical protein
VQLPFDYVLEALRSFSFSFHVLEVLRSFFLLFFPPTTYSRRCRLIYVSSCYTCPHTTIHLYTTLCSLYARTRRYGCASAASLRLRARGAAVFFFFCVRACIFVYTTITITTIYSLYHYY